MGIQFGVQGNVTHQWTEVLFDTAFSEPPVFIARTTSGYETEQPYILDIKDVTTTGAMVRVEECMPCGDCQHVAERIEWFALPEGIWW